MPGDRDVRHCSDCGTELAETYAFKACAECREKKRYEAAAKAQAERRLVAKVEKEKKKQERIARKARIRQRNEAEKVKARQVAKKAREEERIRKRIAAREANEFTRAQRELASRELSKRHLLPFVLRTLPNYDAGWVHRDICRRLEKFSQDVVDKKSPRLMLQMPPRHGKSELASIRFPAWHLGRNPDHEVIACSYAGSLALGFSRKVRRLIRSTEFETVFDGSGIDPENANAEGWSTIQGGAYLPAGVGGPITGKGAHVLIIDDPIKNMEEADSQTTRESQKDWYMSTAYTRLAPGGGVLVIQTRWHDDDLSGWLEREMREGNADQWEIVRYPALAEEDEWLTPGGKVIDYHVTGANLLRQKGEALHPERYSKESLLQIKNVANRRVWSALYQQTPVASEGEYFKKYDFRYYTARPSRDRLSVFSVWDLAIGKKERNDYTVGGVFGVDEAGQLFLLDLYRGKWSTDEIVKAMCDSYETWQPDEVGIEKGHISMAIGPPLKSEIAERIKAGKKFFYRWSVDNPRAQLVPGRRDKETRARAIQGRFEKHLVYLPALDLFDWADKVVDELLRFPAGVNDDIVDVFAWAGLMLEASISLPTSPSKTKTESWKDRLRQMGHGRNKSAMAA